VYEADGIRAERRASARWVPVSVFAVSVLVDMCVRVGVERPAPPAQEQVHGERDDHHPDGGLRRLLDGLGQRCGEEDDRQPEDEQCRRMAQTP